MAKGWQNQILQNTTTKHTKTVPNN